MSPVVACVALAMFGQAEIPLNGTQPEDLSVPPEPSSGCGCHLNYDASVESEPGWSYGGTAMAVSARDPLFQAALAVAHRDQPRLTPTCLRCHAPAGWLAGRSEPGDGSMLTPEDLEGVTCDICHRMIEPAGGTYIGNGQYVLAQDIAKTGARGAAPVSGHAVTRTDYLRKSEMCGVCHSLFNPLEQAHDAAGATLPFNYYEQRTYEEWVDSVFPARKQGCIDCHMKRVDGYSCREMTNRYSDLAHHGIVGANTFAPRAVGFLYPNIDLEPEQVELIERLVAESLASAARLVVTSTHARPAPVHPGQAFSLGVRLTNLTGHKLPTGYPEGRRVYLEVTLSLVGRRPIVVSGRWERASGDLIEDAQLRTYETRHGIVGQGRSSHLALANQVLSDTRLPPEGFRPRAADMKPVGRDYGDGPPYRHWDDHVYTLPIPADVDLATTGTITVRAMHQVTSGRYVRFLVETLGADHPAAADLRRVFAVLDRAPPLPMVAASLPVVVVAAPPTPDAGRVDTSQDGVSQPERTCACRTASTLGEPSWSGCWLVLLWFCAGRWRRALAGEEQGEQ